LTGSELQKSAIFRKIEKVLPNHRLVSGEHQIPPETCFYTYSRTTGAIWGNFVILEILMKFPIRKEGKAANFRKSSKIADIDKFAIEGKFDFKEN
jgi:hypothetical protein